MVNQHYGTMHIIRQCVAPGMLAMHQGRTWNVSAVRGRNVYLRTLRETTRITDCLVEVLLNGKGDPMIQGKHNSHIKCAYCGKPLAKDDAIKATIVYVQGAQLARKKNDYCSQQCAEHDQMAHES